MKDKLDKGSYESYMEVVKRSIDETKKRIATLAEEEWLARLTYEQWVDYQTGKIKLFDPLTISDIRDRRCFNYYFVKGELVKLDESVMNGEEMKKYSDLIGLHAVVTSYRSGLHSFAQGTSYSHHVKFENGYETKDCGCAFPDMVPTWLLIPISDEESEKYIEQYKNTEDKETLWFYIK